ncbi:Histone methylation protein DOT1 [Seminavis robusta]|uniref:Histone methylation protein DOT1 n=1 Tax=Seminavis robusta TaxID=568900 RepID=A0A9N8DDC5_9STRA|nr:Histone methylation protein DOT1 [Seminavis robusta]|eukprot:Sro86_g045790.1 Histone methylation protein DOT1 (363) ;mRNA; f:80430-81518
MLCELKARMCLVPRVSVVFLVYATLFPGFCSAFIIGTFDPSTTGVGASASALYSLGHDYLGSLSQAPSADASLTAPLQTHLDRHSAPLTSSGSAWDDLPPTDSSTTASDRSESISGVSYQKVAEGLDVLYPPTELAARNAKSRTDGYWPFLKGADSEPPVEFTYGEFDALFFAQLLDQAASFFVSSSTTYDGKIVADIGSGAGRLVLGAAALHPRLAKCIGIEILPGIHEMALENVAQCQKQQQQEQQGLLPPHNLPLAPIELVCASISDPTLDISQVDVFFIASTCMPESVLVEIAHAIGCQCRVGTLVMSTDYELLTERTFCERTNKYFQLEKLSQTDGYCWIVGGVSTAFTYRLEESAA